MKKILKKSPLKSSLDKDLLKYWQKVSTKAKLQWLESAMRFGKLRKF